MHYRHGYIDKDLLNCSFVKLFRTALHWAAKRGHVGLTSFLLSHGADRTINTTNGETALDLATHPSVRSLLGDAGAGGMNSFTIRQKWISWIVECWGGKLWIVNNYSSVWILYYLFYILFKSRFVTLYGFYQIKYIHTNLSSSRLEGSIRQQSNRGPSLMGEEYFHLPPQVVPV